LPRLSSSLGLRGDSHRGLAGTHREAPRHPGSGSLRGAAELRAAFRESVPEPLREEPVIFDDLPPERLAALVRDELFPPTAEERVARARRHLDQVFSEMFGEKGGLLSA
jgi:hypothetical protein